MQIEIEKSIKVKNIEEIIVKTIYIGGGTPSYIDDKYIINILEKLNSKYKIAKNAEITIEVNPGTAINEKLKSYYKAGINRLSIGLQSTNNEILKTIGRIHTYEDFLNTYKMARNIGFKNINVDLILALPNQTFEILEDSVNRIIELNPEHISIYSLIIEEGTKLEEQITNKELTLPDENTERNMYYLAKRILEENKYIQYEISNFCKSGFQSKHNLDCWEQKEYIGYGVAAHSYLDKERFSNVNDINKYIENIKSDNIIKNYIIEERQNKYQEMQEFMMLGLRKLDGINISKFKQKFIENPLYIFRKELNKLVEADLIEVDGDNIKLSKKGLDFANLVWEEFI